MSGIRPFAAVSDESIDTRFEDGKRHGADFQYPRRERCGD